MISPVRLIAMDMDGTLLDKQGKIPKANADALRAAKKAGVEFSLCTGRFPENASLVLMECGLSCPIIGVNGAEITDAPMGALLSYHTLADRAAREVLKALRRLNAQFFTFSHKLITTSEVNDVHHSEVSEGAILDKVGVRFAHGAEAVERSLDAGLTKYYIKDTGNLAEIGSALREIEDIELTRSGMKNIEVIPKGVNKGSGLRTLAGHLGIPMESVMALGDQDNDLPMLTCAGYGVAMGNAPDDIKKRAKYETARYDEFGVARAIERFVFGKT